MQISLEYKHCKLLVDIHICLHEQVSAIAGIVGLSFEISYLIIIIISFPATTIDDSSDII